MNSTIEKVEKSRGPVLFAEIQEDGTDTELTAQKIAVVVILSILNVLMFIGNATSILTISLSRCLYSNKTYWIVLNLAIVDLMMSLTVVPVNIAWEYHGIWKFNMVACDLVTIADIGLSKVSAYFIVLVSLDKFIYITKPLAYERMMSTKYVLVAIMVVWVFWIGFAIVAVVGEVATAKDFNRTKIIDPCTFVRSDSYVIFSAVISFWIPFFLLLFTSSKILCVAHYHLKRMSKIYPGLSSNFSAVTNSTYLKQKRNTIPRTPSIVKGLSTIAIISGTIQSEERLSVQSDVNLLHRPKRGIKFKTCRAFGTVLIVVLLFMLMFLPYWMASTAAVICECVDPWIYEDLLSVFYLMHSLVNPYIYMMTDRRYKAAIKVLWKKLQVKLRRKTDTRIHVCADENI